MPVVIVVLSSIKTYEKDAISILFRSYLQGQIPMIFISDLVMHILRAAPGTTGAWPPSMPASCRIQHDTQVDATEMVSGSWLARRRCRARMKRGDFFYVLLKFTGVLSDLRTWDRMLAKLLHVVATVHLRSFLCRLPSLTNRRHWTSRSAKGSYRHTSLSDGCPVSCAHLVTQSAGLNAPLSTDFFTAFGSLFSLRIHAGLTYTPSHRLPVFNFA